MIADILLIAIGLVLLLAAGDLLVRGAVGLASALKIPALVISLTIVAFGTSAPELVVSVQAVLSNSAGIAIGNIIGSNIANTLLVLGAPAIVYPISAHVKGLRRHGVIMALATALFAFVAYSSGVLDTVIGGALFAGILLYIAYMFVRALRGADDEPVLDEIEEYAQITGVSFKTLFFLIAGLVGLPAGAHLLVTHASALAADLGVREEAIGLTIVAFGTSLPELATVLAAAFHRKSDVAIGNIVGSNIFNILAVGGAAGLAGRAVFDPTTLRVDMPVMLGAAVVLLYFILWRRDIGRATGLFMTLAYFGFIAALFFLTEGVSL
ncbi:MAG: calcium/sodium antiporter [Parvularculaceae bacterium]